MKYKYLRCGVVTALALSIGVQSLAPVSIRADTVNDMNTAKSSLDSQVSAARAAGATVIRDSDKTINADTDDSANSQIASDYDSQASSIKKQLADYQTKLNAYNAKLADYKKKTHQEGKTDGSELIQRLRLGDEPNAKVVFTRANGVYVTTNRRVPPSEVPDWLGRGWFKNTDMTLIGFGGNTSGTLGTATWTNLRNAYYTKPSTGQEIKIGKITMTFSNESTFKSNLPSYRNYANGPFKQFMKSNNAKNGLAVFDNIACGAWFINSDSINVSIDFYDSNGKPISFEKNSAYLGFGSLNHWDRNSVPWGHPGSGFYHKECVQGLKNVTGINLAGSLVTNHAGNDEYANNATTNNNDMWAAFAVSAVSGSSATFRWHMEHSNNDGNYNQLYTFGTAIPSYSGLNSVRPMPLTLHYHYDKKHVKYTVTANYIGVKNGKNTTIADSMHQTVYTGDSYSTSAKSVTGWKLTGTPTNATGTNISSNITVNYYYAPIPVKLIVRYLDAKTGKELSPSSTTTKYYKDSYTTSPVSIKGHHVSTYPANAKGVIGTSDVVVTYYYDRDTEHVKANYKSKDGLTLADSDVFSGLFGDPYHTDSKNILGWWLPNNPSNKDGIFDINNPDVNYIYERDPEIVYVRYVDTRDHKKELAPRQRMMIEYGLPYTTQAANVPGYHLVAVPDNATGVGDAAHLNKAIIVTYEYDTNPSIKEGISNSAVNDSNRDSVLNTTSLKGRYSNTYHYVSKVNVGGSLTLDDLTVSTTLTPGLNPIINGKTIRDQDIKVYEVDSHGKLKDITRTRQGYLSYSTVDGNPVKHADDANVAIDLDKSRVVSWTAIEPSDFVGKTIYMDIPVTIPPDGSKLTSYRTNSGISVSNSATLCEENDVSSSSMYRESKTSPKRLSSNSVKTSLPNIYTAKVYKSIFNTASTINGKVYVKVYPNLVGKASGTTSKAISVVSNGQTQSIDVPLSSKSAIVNATISSSKAANNKTFDVKLNSNRTSSGTDDVILAKSLISSEHHQYNVTTTTYNPDSSMYSDTTQAAQYAPKKTPGTDASGVEAVETYYDQYVYDPQYATPNEMQPLYVKLMEYMHSNYKSSVSAKAGYGIKNDVDLNYYGRHLSRSSDKFISDDLATTFSTAKDLTSANGKSTSKRNNPQSELMDYDLEIKSVSQLKSAVNNSSDKTAALNKYFKSGDASIMLSNPINSDYMLDQASTDVSLTTPFANLSREQKDYVASVDTETNTKPASPKLYSMEYKFNKRLLDNGIEYYDPNSSHVKNNRDVLSDNGSTSDAKDGGNLFYTNQWLPLSNYATTYQSHAFGSNDFVFKLNRNLNIYGHRYLAKGDGENGDEYDDIAIQPVISTDSNSANTTLPSDANWKDK